MTTGVIIDAGPLVALLDHRDTYHGWMVIQARTLPVPWAVCEAVLTEAWYLLRHARGAQDSLLKLMDEGPLRITFDLASEAGVVRTLCHKYPDVPMSLADACIVRMSELNARHAVLTLDSDFSVYRRFGREPLPLVAPWVR